MSERNLFNSDHGVGKGDKPRTPLNSNYRKRFSKIRGFGKATGFVSTGGRQVKSYGPAARLTLANLSVGLPDFTNANRD